MAAQYGENYLLDLKEQGFALKFIRNEGERMVKDGCNNNEVTKMIAQIAEAYECTPVEGVLSHQVRSPRHQQHARVSTPLMIFYHR